MQFTEELLGAKANKEAARVLIIALSALPLSVLTAVLPRDVPVKWGWVGIAVAIAAIVIVKIGLFDGMFKEVARRSVPAWEVAMALTIFNVAAGISVYAGSGPIGIYRQLLVILVVWWALLGDVGMLGYGTIMATLALGAATYAQGVRGPVVFTIMFQYGFCWAATGIVILMLVTRVRRAREQSARFTDTAGSLSQLASVAARSRDLESALHSSVGLVGKVLNAHRVRVISVARDASASSVLASWASSWQHESEADFDSPQLREAATSGVLFVENSTAWLPVGEFEGALLVFVLEGCDEIERDGDEGTLASVATVLTNMVERVTFVRRLEDLVRTDPLTGLANRRALMERLDHDIEFARRTRSPLCVVMIDLDYFKSYNDAYGHIAGDKVLHDVAGAFAERAREADTVARYGGEEFCLSLPETDVVSAVKLISDQRRKVHDVPSAKPITFSAGVAQWDGEESIRSLLARADAALYGAKVHGRDRVEAAQAAAGRTSRL